MALRDLLLLLHPVAAVLVVFPLLGLVVPRALQTRQRRLQTNSGEKSKMPAVVGSEYVQVGRWLTGAVVGVVLLALANDVLGNLIDKNVWAQQPFTVLLTSLLFGVAIASLALLYQTRQGCGGVSLPH